MQQRLQSMLPRQIIKRIPVSWGELGKLGLMAVTNHIEQRPPKLAPANHTRSCRCLIKHAGLPE